MISILLKLNLGSLLTSISYWNCVMHFLPTVSLRAQIKGLFHTGHILEHQSVMGSHKPGAALHLQPAGESTKQNHGIV